MFHEDSGAAINAVDPTDQALSLKVECGHGADVYIVLVGRMFLRYNKIVAHISVTENIADKLFEPCLIATRFAPLQQLDQMDDLVLHDALKRFETVFADHTADGDRPIHVAEGQKEQP